MSRENILRVLEDENPVPLSMEEVRVIEAVSPTVDLERVGNETHMTVKDLRGTHSVVIYDGEKGDPGDPGEPGYTPSKGTDYWTEEDQETIIDEITRLYPMETIINAMTSSTKAAEAASESSTTASQAAQGAIASAQAAAESASHAADSASDAEKIATSIFASAAQIETNKKDIADLKSQSPKVVDSDATDADLDISDQSGNVILRFANGEIRTKKFDSARSPAIKDSTKNGVDLDITDNYGNVILRLKNGGIQTKNFDSTNLDGGVHYVAPNGSDSNDGKTESTAFATFQHAIDTGCKRIIAAPGEYKNQQISINGLHDISIICNSNTTEETLFESHVRRTRAKIDNSIDITGLTAYNSVYRTALTVDEDSSFYKVFISKTLDPVYSGSSYYGRVTTYNAILWEITEGIEDCTRLVPKLTLADCEANTGSFYFDGSYLYINPTGGVLGNKAYKRLNLDTNQYGINIRNCTDIHIQGIDVAFFPYYDMRFAHCEAVMVKDCCCTFTSYGSAVEVEGADATFISCVAAKAGADGFGIAAYGNVSFYDCSAFYCYDDGISHHDAATGVVDGGQWVGCLKGGVTPSFGSNVAVKNVVCRDNVYGIYITQSGDRVTDAALMVQNCLAVNNTTKDIRVTGYDVISHGCVYGTKQVDDGASLTEYGNTIIA